mgnify:CR=1 FL=1
MSVFASEDQRRRYDASLDDELMLGLRDHLHAAGANRTITPAKLDTLVRLARERGEAHIGARPAEGAALKRL